MYGNAATNHEKCSPRHAGTLVTRAGPRVALDAVVLHVGGVGLSRAAAAAFADSACCCFCLYLNYNPNWKCDQ